MRRRSLLPIPLILAAVFAAFQYFGAEKAVNPETGRVARVGMSEQQEQALGFQSYQAEGLCFVHRTGVRISRTSRRMDAILDSCQFVSIRG